MRQWKRLTFFLLLNILVSACTTLGVLVAWDRLRAPLPGGLIQPVALRLLQPDAPTATAAPTTVAALDATIAPAYLTHVVADGDDFTSIAQTYHVSVDELVSANGFSQAQVLSPGDMLRIPLKPAFIDSVIGAGDLNSEHIVITNNLDGELSLVGWQLDNNIGSVYNFPVVKIFGKGNSLAVYTQAGADTPEKLYWGLQAPLYQTGMQVALRDPQGKIQAIYTVP